MKNFFSVLQFRFLFRNSREYTNTGKRVLANLLFNDDEGIGDVSFDIEAIEDDWRKGVFDMWAYSFQERQGTINRGSLYSEQRISSTDPLYQDTAGAPRNFVGIYVTFGDREVKVRVTREGTVTIYGNYEGPTQQPAIVNFIRDLLSSYRV